VRTYQVFPDSDNRIRLPIPTQNLLPGGYTVKLELLMRDLTKRSKYLQKNIPGEFSFEVTRVYTVMTFTGEYLIEAERIRLTEGIQQAVEHNTVPVQLVTEPIEVQNRYRFIIAVNTAILPPIALVNTVEMVLWDITIGFTKNRETLEEPRKKRITEPRTNFDRTLPQAVDFIRDNTAFFQGVNEKISR
jgi:hypothetical protein